MSFDTTAANTGYKSGACVLLEQKMEKKNYYNLPCRHHIFEIVISGVFESVFGNSTGPIISKFENFQKNLGHSQQEQV